MTIDISLTIKELSKCSGSELDKFVDLVKSEGEVMHGLKRRVQLNGESLIFLYQSGVLAGTAAIKRPNEHYRSTVFRKAKASFEPSDFPFELGWIVVHSDFRKRGFAKTLIKKAMTTVKFESVFATTRNNNSVIHRYLESQGFSLCGKSYSSGIRDEHLVLFTKK